MFRSLVLILVIFVAIVYTQQQQHQGFHACEADRAKFCPNAHFAEIHQCFKEHKDLLSAECRKLYDEHEANGNNHGGYHHGHPGYTPPSSQGTSGSTSGSNPVNNPPHNGHPGYTPPSSQGTSGSTSGSNPTQVVNAPHPPSPPHADKPSHAHVITEVFKQCKEEINNHRCDGHKKSLSEVVYSDCFVLAAPTFSANCKKAYDNYRARDAKEIPATGANIRYSCHKDFQNYCPHLLLSPWTTNSELHVDHSCLEKNYKYFDEECKEVLSKWYAERNTLTHFFASMWREHPFATMMFVMPTIAAITCGCLACCAACCAKRKRKTRKVEDLDAEALLTEGDEPLSQEELDFIYGISASFKPEVVASAPILEQGTEMQQMPPFHAEYPQLYAMNLPPQYSTN